MGPLQPEPAEGGLPDHRQADVLHVHRHQRLAARRAQPAGAERRQHRAPGQRARSSAAAASTCRSPSVRTSFDLFRGDTAFRPIDWRVRVAAGLQRQLRQPAGIRRRQRRRARASDTRLDHRTSASRKPSSRRSCSTSARTTTSCRCAPASRSSRPTSAASSRCSKRRASACSARSKSSRIEYNAAFFDLLEKDTNSGFNELHRRNQQVYIANVYIQDFLTPGYTPVLQLPRQSTTAAQLHYDHNGFLVRPAPIGVIATQRRAGVLPRLGRQRPHRPLNVSHAFYQALGHETHEPDRRRSAIDINAQMARARALDRQGLAADQGRGLLSPRATAIRLTTRRRGFDAIVDIPVFAGGPFSLWNRRACAWRRPAPASSPPSACCRRCARTRTKGSRTSSTPASSSSTAPRTSS